MTVEVTSTGWMTYEGKVYIDRGNGTVAVESEQIVIFGGFGEYIWHNTAGDGGSGTTSESSGGNGANHDTEVTSGPNKGKKRHWVKQ